MANLDSSIPFSGSEDESLVIKDGGANSITLTFAQGGLVVEEEQAPYVEARTRNKHQATPVVRKTGNGNLKITLKCLVTSFKGTANVHPYEALTFSGNAAAWASTSTGDKKTLQLEHTLNSTVAGGGSQLRTYKYCVPGPVSLDPMGADGLFLLSCELTDLEEAPTIA